jgi:hypothetical protein
MDVVLITDEQDSNEKKLLLHSFQQAVPSVEDKSYVPFC